MIVTYERRVSKALRDIIENSLNVAYSFLMPRTKNVYINIEAIKNLKEKEGVHGDCFEDDEREFTIRVDSSQPINEIIITILHEMIHVNQYVKKQMQQKLGSEVIYNKKVYPSDMEYDSRPWEIEAHNLEKELFELYKVKYEHTT